MTLSESRIDQILGAFAGRRIAVIGDVMLDRFFRGDVSRISPEAPVPVIDIEDESEHPGGAANVGYNLVELGASPLLISVVGNDGAGLHLRRLLRELGIGDDGLVTDPERLTTEKTRIIAASQHICRVDKEHRGEINSDVEQRVLAMLDERIGELDGLILQDYNKGVVTASLIRGVVERARAHGLPVHVDPKYHNFFEYTGVTVFKPNRKEAEDALRASLRTDEDRRRGAAELLERLQSDHVILTLGADGMMIAGRDEEPVLVPTRAMQVADVSGAGDTVIATLSTACAAGATVLEAAVIANHAAGVVCAQVGTVPVQYRQLREALISDCRDEAIVE
ncbi:MAG: D-glycero-beta-D-manno-heptose-7-phosphate kinase [bacterium]|nr:D-glycero-beta-D-manno-heptose-7-phosphate kinase [Candidatus Kapabacteria bacterium]